MCCDYVLRSVNLNFFCPTIMDPLAPDEIKIERLDDEEEEEDQLMIDDEDSDLIDENNIEDPTDDTNDDQVRLEKLPRPVNELNCRQARTFLVKLLRAANGGNNPQYGNPESRPPFWPDYYWPWERLFDVHTKPRGMNEPLQYSEMMKLAIGRGYQYFGYDPQSYVRKESDPDPLMAEPIVSMSISEDPFVHSDDFDSSKFYLRQPPRLPRALLRINCVQARTALAKLLRYQQCGNNPVYGSPDTEPPWWPNDLIRWVDMVDLRGKPPYLPDTKSYTDVLKIAISNAYAYYGFDPDKFVEDAQDPLAGIFGGKQRMFPVIPAAGIAPPPPPKNLQYTVARSVPNFLPPAATQQIVTSATAPKAQTMTAAVVETQIPKENSSVNANVIELSSIEDDDEDMGELPPKLPMPVGKMNCSITRTCLAKLIRFHCGRGQLPNYGNPASMPVWWPNHIIDWTKIKNLSHRYEGYLGNTYSNCLRIAMIRGYAHYGLDANEYVENKGIREPYQPLYNSPLDTFSSNSEANLMQAQSRVIMHPSQQPQSGISYQQMPKPTAMPPPSRPPPLLVPLSSMVSEGHYPQSLLNTRDWFPPRLATSKGCEVPQEAVKMLKPCKVLMDNSIADKASRFSLGSVGEDNRMSQMFDFFRQDLKEQKFTDLTLMASKRTPNRPKEKLAIKVHRIVLAAHSQRLNRMLRVIINILIPFCIDLKLFCHQDLDDDNPCLVLSGVNGSILQLIVQALYTGQVNLDGKTQLRQFETALTCLHSFGILLNLRPGVVIADENGGQMTMTKHQNEEEKDESEGENDAESPASVIEDVVIAKTKKRKRVVENEPEIVEEDEDDIEKVDEAPTRKRTRATQKIAKNEATKPNFDKVTPESLNNKMKEGHLPFVQWLQNEGFLKKSQNCTIKDCSNTNQPMQLLEDQEDIDGVIWKCSKCHCKTNIREGSIFGRQHKKSTADSLSWIIQIILCWSDNTSLMQCQQMTGADVDKIFLWYDECKDYYGAL